MIGFRFTRKAETDVDLILDYTLATWGEAQAGHYLAGLYDVLELIAGNPGMGRPRPELAPDIHGFPYRRHTVFYIPFGEEIVVIRVLNSARNIRPEHVQDRE